MNTAEQQNKVCKSILIVEDDESIRDALRMILEFEGYTIFTAENGKVGLELLPNIPTPCLIVVDLMMPVMDGMAFIEALDQNMILATLPVVVVTAFTEKAKLITKTQGVLKKPVDMDTLLTMIKKYCG